MVRFLAVALALGGCNSATDSRAQLQRVDDRASLISVASELRLNSELASLENATSDQVQVVTMPTLGGRPIEAASLDLARAEGLGIRGKDNGVLLMVAPNERKLRIEVGTGLEGLLSNARAATIISHITPRFRAGAMEGGIEQGISEIDQLLRSDTQRPLPARKDKR